MEIQDINFNENIIKENESLLSAKKSEFKLNLNPFVAYERSKELIDNNSLDYLKEIAKSEKLVTYDYEEGGRGLNKHSSRKSKEKQRLNKRNKVTFKESLIEPEEKKGIIFF